MNARNKKFIPMSIGKTKYINTSNKLKIWTIITHALIVAAVGHGAVFFFLLELGGLFYIDGGFAPLSFLMLAGQVLIIISIFNQSIRYKLLIHIAGLLLLWTAIIFFKVNIQKGSGDKLTDLFMAPFAICTFITFAGIPVKRLYNQLTGKI